MNPTTASSIGLAALAGAFGIVSMTAPPAQAASCAFDSQTRTVSVAINGEDIAVQRSGDAIMVAGQPCDGATVFTTDTVHVTGAGADDVLRISLQGGAFEPGATKPIDFVVDLGGQTNVDSLAIIGSAGNDTISWGGTGINLGNDADVDVVFSGVDQLTAEGLDGDDVLSGQGGHGTGTPIQRTLLMNAGAGDDVLRGGDGRDLLIGMAGNDTLDGASSPVGGDGVAYPYATGPVMVDLDQHQASGADGFDTVLNIESVSGGPFGDLLRGDPADNSLHGEGGNDQIFGNTGNDEMVGGPGNDSLNGQGGIGDLIGYNLATTGVTVNLAAGSATGDGTDSITGVENAVGSAFADTLTGSTTVNSLYGIGGNDVLKGGVAADGIYGGDGIDTASYTGSRGSVTVNLTTNTASGGEVLADIETVAGTAFADTLTGSAGPDRLIGNGGNDVLAGLGGNDSLVGGAGRDTATYATAPGAVIVDLAGHRHRS